MENKKLLKFLLKDLNELDEMVAEKGSNSFDELEMEFLHTRVKGAIKLIQILHDRENNPKIKEKEVQKDLVQKIPVEKIGVQESIEGEPEIINVPEVVVKEVIQKNEKVEETIEDNESEAKNVSKNVVQHTKENPEQVEESETEDVVSTDIEEDKSVELEEEEESTETKHRLGDSFSKEKSVNDLMGADNKNLEHKLSNRPVANIQAAIGINDRFQFIRELFDGNADIFVSAVSDLDKMGDIKEAVKYLQKNYKWKKNETSLKFVNLVKRRFSNE